MGLHHSRTQHFWSPRLFADVGIKNIFGKKAATFSTIYHYISKKEFPSIKKESHLRRHSKRLQTKNANYNSIQSNRIIPGWPDEIYNRTRLGDWEGDTVYGGVGKGLIVSLVDRKSRFLKIALLENRVAERTRLVTEKTLKGFPTSSISLDNGSEFSEFRKLEENLNTMVYFVEPHKPWQRGTNENTNDIIRFSFLKVLISGRSHMRTSQWLRT